MTSPTYTQDLTQTANVYKLISLLYGPPTDGLEEILTLSEQTLVNLKPELIPIVNEMKTLSDSKSKLEDLTVDYAKLFIGPFDLLAPPYGSVYLEGQRRVMGDSTVKVLQFYRQAGLNLSDEFKEPPDHIVTELEFMYYLIAKHIETGDKQWLVMKEEFFNNFLSPWIKDFSIRILENARTVFYKNLAQLTLGLIS
ncbi:molecular chaperone [Desulfosporosinus sp.]|uniref:TorD/DmsD family molecular chaperone n=1 Tax=Desulfosporosinus sp. TaxID=157907 RepID=UPI0025C6F179|nr:molecular chaperone TorD family protein [Desulfosporosinus sp.]MBC2722950.1 molecular chaperone TorD family protein [Desulfosporosinus sp.]MBC2727366.1 molecular chaperone TorD family protein [Desulfosporosinus sp.]